MKKSGKVVIASIMTAALSLGCFVPSFAATSEITWPDMFGDQSGNLTVNQEENTWELSFENPYGSHLIAGTYSPDDYSMECTDDAGMGTFLPLDAIFAAAGEAIGNMSADDSGEVNAGGESVTVEITWPDMFGDQNGNLTVNQEENTWELSFENPYGKHLIAGTYSPEDYSMECTDDAGMGTFIPFDVIYPIAEEAIAAVCAGEITGGEGEVKTEAETAEEDMDFEAYKEIITWDVLDFPTVFEQLPDAYNTYDTQYKGSETFIHYTTDVYEDGVEYQKFARVYLPYGYNPEDTETKYNVVYLQHGNNCSPSNFFDLVPPTADFNTLLDNMFDPEHGVMDPCIIVCPTYYLGIEDLDTTVEDNAIAGDGRSEGIPGNYYKEVVEDLIPAVESQLNVYCDDFSPEGIKATRDHRAWAGFSRGSVCTWYIFHHDLEYFRYFMPTSANCLEEGKVPGAESASSWTDEDAYNYIKEAVDANPDLPFYIIAQSGAANDAPAMRTQMKYFLDKGEIFSYGLNPEVNNFYYTCSDFQHVQQYIPYYMYTARNILFK